MGLRTGLIDGTLAHQVLQWHHLLAGTGDYRMTPVAGLQANTLADGSFHPAAWMFIGTAMLLTVRAGQRRGLARDGARASGRSWSFAAS